ncbi:hypothetical protein ACWEJJ_24850, partial [Streptomyces rubiginosohelvolus]
ARAVGIGERLGVLKDYPTSPGCTSPYAPEWIGFGMCSWPRCWRPWTNANAPSSPCASARR